MVDAVRWLVDAGRVKLYCVDSADAFTWSDRRCHWRNALGGTTSTNGGCSSRSRVHPRGLRGPHRPAGDGLQPWRLPRGQPGAAARRPGPAGAVHVRLLRPGGVERLGRARRGGLLPQPHRLRREPAGRPPGLASLGGLPGARRRPGSWEVDPTRALPSTRQFAGLLADKGIPHELDVWGHDVPHDWPSWQPQLAHHLPTLLLSTAQGLWSSPSGDDGASGSPWTAMPARHSASPTLASRHAAAGLLRARRPCRHRDGADVLLGRPTPMSRRQPRVGTTATATAG